MHENLITGSIIELAIKVHKTLGPGLFESVYQECLFYELKNEGFEVEKEKILPVVYGDVRLKTGFRLDLLVENKIIVELKTVERLTDLHLAQLLTYLKLSECRVGLLLNFNVSKLKNGIQRVVNN
ncbi:GxxExxY protein [Marinilabilia salmonicolor]|jgi:GxxExxY protein|uniref:GxxExxY protein n=1 Tax=Marinilabilia salmonicolor TaxID=989 RepID=A0A2T0XSF3_9BACT|nr:GxxExxY protein [Marinilabilia salmonicolor]PRZ01863.1 GxxExxY protein [Marinilabilia salmonicolor]RCW32058.1 GxxExxY protein [Marinilabilia salmonicolor]